MIVYGIAQKDGVFIVTVDKLPFTEDMTYDKIAIDDHSYLYYAYERDSGYVSFMLSDDRDQRGYGGREFKLNLRDKTVATVKGPWSSRSDVVNGWVDKETVDVTYITSNGNMMAGHMLKSKLI